MAGFTKDETAVVEHAKSLYMADGLDPQIHWASYAVAAAKAILQEHRNRK